MTKETRLAVTSNLSITQHFGVSAGVVASEQSATVTAAVFDIFGTFHEVGHAAGAEEAEEDESPDTIIEKGQSVSELMRLR